MDDEDWSCNDLYLKTADVLDRQQGPKKMKLFENMDVKLLLPTVAEDTTSKIQHLWSELIELNNLICLPASKLTG